MKRTMRDEPEVPVATSMGVGGLAGWLLSRIRRGDSRPPRLAVVERVTLAPRHSLALVEAEGRRLLVATAAEGAPVFYALDSAAASSPGSPRSIHSVRRISW